MNDITRRGFVKGVALAPLAFTPFTQPQSSEKAEHFDIVIAGAGHNSLAAACYLSKAGYRCLVLEGRPMIGGGTKTAELTLRGFHHDVCSCDHQTIQGNPMLRNDELNLRDYGLEYIFPDPVYHVPFRDGSYITQWQDLDRTVEEFAKFSKKDAQAYRRMVNEVEVIRPLIHEYEFTPIGFGKGLNERLADHPQGKYWRRRMIMSAWDILHDNFEDPHCITFMMTPWPSGVAGPNSGLSAYSKASRHPSSPLPKGGSGELAHALAGFLEAHGSVILTNKAVVKLVLDGGKCTGVECADGSIYRADKAVLSSIHIKHLVEMAPRDVWGDDFLDGVETFHVGPAGFNTHYALKEPVKYPVKGGTLLSVHSTTLQSPERALKFETEIACGEVNLEDPVLHIVQTSVADPTRAPAGMHTMRILGREPWNLKDGGAQHWDEIKEKVADAHLKAVRRLAPNLTDDVILARFITNPLDLERLNPHSYQGCCHGGTDGPAQAGALRPAPGWAQHRMPIPGLYQTGGTTHPGGGVTGGPGRNAAWVMLKDFGTSIEQVVSKKS